MRLFAIFLILNIQLSHIFASPPNPLELSSQTRHGRRGYECGNYFFADVEVKEALSLALDSIDKEYQYPLRYQGPLYSESRFEDYFLYPIRNGPQVLPHYKRSKTVFYIVLTRNSNEEVDVVSKVTTGDYTKCIRRHNSHTGPSYSVPENANGYLCAHQFFTDDIIHQSLALALTKIGEKAKYFSRYVGSLYPENSGHLMWPIVIGKPTYKRGEVKFGPYFLILNNQRQVVDVVVKGFSDNFLRCIRSRKPPKAPASDPYSKLFVPPPEPGYLCGKVIFHDRVLEEHAVTIKGKADKVGKAIESNLPEEYFGPPYNEQCLMWPLLRNGRLFRNGHKGPFRLILTPEYKVLSVAMFAKGRLKACERKTIVAKKNHDTSNYHCNEQYFTHQELVEAAEEACVRMKTVIRSIYPARYQGPGFKTDGPYFTYPVIRNCVFGRQSFNVGLHRVVINSNCEVVGALTTLKKYHNGIVILKRLVKCHRLADGPLPPWFFGANAQTVFEHKDRN